MNPLSTQSHSFLERSQSVLDGLSKNQTPGDRAAYLATALPCLWNTPIGVCVLRDRLQTVAAAVDDKGALRPDWGPLLVPGLEKRLQDDASPCAGLPIPSGVLANDGICLHAVSLTCQDEDCCVLAIALPKELSPADKQSFVELCSFAYRLTPWLHQEPVQRQAGAGSAGEEELSGLMLHADMAEAVMHDVNNLVNNVVLQLEVLKRTETSATFASKVDGLQQKCRQVAGLLKKLHSFDVSRPTVRQPVDLNRLVREIVAGGGNRVPKHWPAPIDLDMDQEVPPLPANPLDLTRLIDSLLRHATALTPHSARVTVRTQRLKNGCRLIVEDQGPPVATEELHRLLEPFTMVRPGGPEWALAVSKILARRMHSTLRAENRPEGGMTFHVDFDLGGLQSKTTAQSVRPAVGSSKSE